MGPVMVFFSRGPRELGTALHLVSAGNSDKQVFLLPGKGGWQMPGLWPFWTI